MTLPSSGQLAMSQINVELDMSSTLANSSLHDASTGTSPYPSINTASEYYPNGSMPYAISEFYGYNHDATAYSVDISMGLSDCSPTSIYVAGSSSGATRIDVVIQEWDGATPNGSDSQCVTPGGGGDWSWDFGAPNSGTDTVDITAYLYTNTSCTGGYEVYDTYNGMMCAS